MRLKHQKSIRIGKRGRGSETGAQLEGALGGGGRDLCPFCEKSCICRLNDSFLPSFLKATWIYFTGNNQNHFNDVLILPSDPCPSTFLVAFLWKSGLKNRICQQRGECVETMTKQSSKPYVIVPSFPSRV